MANGNGTDMDEGDQPFIRITNAVVYAELQAARADLRALAAAVQDYPETKARVKKLELRFYGILAGLVSALGAVVFLSSKVGGV